MQRARSAFGLLVLASAALCGGACGRIVHLGDLTDGGGSITTDAGDGGTLLWQATFEPGDLSEWMADGNGGAYGVASGGATPTITTDVAHNGSYAGVATIAPVPGVTTDSYCFRNQPSPTQAFYSAWYYIPSNIQLRSWLSVIHIRVSQTGDGHNLIPVWDFNANQRPDGTVVPHLYNFIDKMNREEFTPTPFPRDTWFHLEMLFRKAAGPTGQISIWQDGQLVLDARNEVTAATDWIEWAVGIASTDLSPSPASVYIDDAAISLTRIGAAP